MPASKYNVECISATVVVLFHNADKNVHQQAFLIPTSDEVAIDDYKLVFTVHGHQHYMQELWNSNEKRFLLLASAWQWHREIRELKSLWIRISLENRPEGMDPVIDEISLATAV